ncbi:MAG: zf-HC2 domain-containing protein [Elusimicrobia bacterium]|nr:zf-HC2 domain-containing protein [Elusimicrobiota bacterium]
MDHKDVKERILTHYDGELPPGERAAVEDHLKTCVECSLLLREWKTTAGAFFSVPPVAPSEAFVQRVMRKMDQEPKETPSRFRLTVPQFALVLRPDNRRDYEGPDLSRIQGAKSAQASRPVSDEQRRSRPKMGLPEGARRFWAASLPNFAHISLRYAREIWLRFAAISPRHNLAYYPVATLAGAAALAALIVFLSHPKTPAPLVVSSQDNILYVAELVSTDADEDDMVVGTTNEDYFL